MGKLSPWEENCHSATQCTRLGQNFTSPASSPMLFSATAAWVGQRPRGALLWCIPGAGSAPVHTDHGPPGNENPETTKQREREMLFGALCSITRSKGASAGSSESGTSHSQQAHTAWSSLFSLDPPRRGCAAFSLALSSSGRPLC